MKIEEMLVKFSPFTLKPTATAHDKVRPKIWLLYGVKKKGPLDAGTRASPLSNKGSECHSIVYLSIQCGMICGDVDYGATETPNSRVLCCYWTADVEHRRERCGGGGRSLGWHDQSCRFGCAGEIGATTKGY